MKQRQMIANQHGFTTIAHLGSSFGAGHAVKEDTVEQRAMCGSVITPLIPSRCRGSTVKEASCVPSSYLICNRLY